MPRGNTKDNRSKSPFVVDIDASTDDMRALSRYALNIFEHNAPNINDADAVKECILEYFSMCEHDGIRPSNLGLYAYIGLSKQQVSNIVNGRDKVNPLTRDLLKKAQVTLSSYREGLAMNGKLNPVTAIFWSKNFDGMTDTQTLEIQTDRNDAPQLTQEELNKRIPVYSDIEQDET